MAEPAVAAIQPVISKFVDESYKWTSAQLGYIWNYRTNFKKLETELDNLNEKKDAMAISVGAAVNNGETIREVVLEWQHKANEMIEEVTNIVEQNQNAQMKCFNNLCPDLRKRYRLSRNAVEKANDVVVFYTKQFDPISYRDALLETFPLADEFMVNFESRMTILNDVIDALKHENVVGIHGMGGVGKTTLAHKVCEEMRKGKQFEFVVFVEVTKHPDVEKIRGKIADILNLTLDKDDPSARATQLSDMLKTKGKVLIILDNMWETIDLNKVGIPLYDGEKGCRMLLTTRETEVLNQMDCEKRLPVETLNTDDSWNLFKNKAGPCVDQSDVQPIAKEVAKRCAGLPIAIVTVAKALKGKSVASWNNALQELLLFPENKMEAAYSCIEWSYGHLKSERHKSTFLLCSIIALISEPSVENVLRYGLSSNVFERFPTMEGQRNNACALIEDLKDCSLLLKSSDDEIFSIHDVVREAGTRIIGPKKGCHIFSDIQQPLQRGPPLENLTWIFLIDIINELPNELNCPKLTFCYLKTKDALVRPSRLVRTKTKDAIVHRFCYLRPKARFSVPHDFFQRMPELIVVHIEGFDLMELPKSLVCLKKLQALYLESCVLGDISTIGDIKDLEILVIFKSSWKKMELPQSIGMLSQLRLMDLRETSFTIPLNIISRLTRLEGLYVSDDVDDDDRLAVVEYVSDVVDYDDDRLAVVELKDLGHRCRQYPTRLEVEELKDLGHLSTLHVRIPDAAVEVLRKSKVFGNLHSYNIVIGDNFKYNRQPESSNTLQVVSKTNICWEEVIQQFQRIDILVLGGEHLVNNTICYDGVGPECFSQLRRIEIQGCHKLKYLFPLSIAKQLLVLEEIKVEKCNKIEEIFTCDRIEDGASDPISLKTLRCLTLRELPRLTRFCSEMEVASSTSQEIQVASTSNAYQLDSLPPFREKIVFPTMTSLYMKGTNIAPRQLACLCQNLTEMTIEECNNLKHVFSSSTLSRVKHLRQLRIRMCMALEVLVRIDDDNTSCIEFPSLERLQIVSCRVLREVIGRRCRVLEGTAIMFSFPQLTTLHLESLHEFGRFYKGEYNMECPKLKRMEVEDFRGVVDLFELQKHDTIDPPPRPQGAFKSSLLQNLESLEVWYCRNLMNVLPQSSIFSNLKIIKVQRCDNLMSLMDASTAEGLVHLEEMEIIECNMMTQIVQDSKMKMKVQDKEITFKNLKKLEWKNLIFLRSFFSGYGTLDLPSLHIVNIENCPTLQSFSSGNSKTKVLKRVSQDKQDYNCNDDLNEIVGQHHKLKIFEREKLCLKNMLQNIHPQTTTDQPVFSKLKQLVCLGDDINWLHQTQQVFLIPNLERLQIIQNKSASTFPLAVLHTYQTVEKVKLSCSSFEQIFSYGDIEKHSQAYARLEKLVLSDLDNLKEIWNKDVSRLDPIPQNNIIKLRVESCGSLVKLMPSSSSFHNLTSLTIAGCDGLMNLFDSATAKSLVKLRRLEIQRCKMMKEIISNGEASRDVEITFQELYSLYLCDLPHLTSFYPENCTFTFPSLRYFNLRKCPKMKFFSLGALNTPILEEIDHDGTELICRGDLNATIQDIHEKLYGKTSPKDHAPEDSAGPSV